MFRYSPRDVVQGHCASPDAFSRIHAGNVLTEIAAHVFEKYYKLTNQASNRLRPVRGVIPRRCDQEVGAFVLNAQSMFVIFRKLHHYPDETDLLT